MYEMNKEIRRSNFDQQCSNNVNKITEKLRWLKIQEFNNNNKFSWIGDTMNYDKGWPNMDQQSTLRIFHVNLNGMTYHNKYL